jgi:catechol 2,3-dioxygenase-like lactoylglutathione lyase family enzyme
MALIKHILETSLYVRDIDEAERFYKMVFDLTTYGRGGNRHLFFRIGESMLLLFNSEETSQSGSTLPTHGAVGAGHAAFAVSHADLEFWRKRLSGLQIPIELEYEWPSGGKSIYFRDPSGNSLEFATPDTWPEQ